MVLSQPAVHGVGAAGGELQRELGMALLGAGDIIGLPELLSESETVQVTGKPARREAERLSSRRGREGSSAGREAIGRTHGGFVAVAMPSL
jgi:hypothetical protein